MRTLKLSALVLGAAMIIVALTAFPQRLCFNGGTAYTFYIGTSSADCREVTVTDNPALTRLQLSKVCGESTEYTEFNLNSFLKENSATVIFEEKLTDSVNYYCKANLPYSVELYGEEINLHICIRSDGVKVASPIIFGGY